MEPRAFDSPAARACKAALAFGLVCVAALTATALPPAVASRSAAEKTEKKVCRESCRDARRACLDDIAAQFSTDAAACQPARDGRACRAAAKRAYETSAQACRQARKACGQCCKRQSGICSALPEPPVFTGSFERSKRGDVANALEQASFPPGPDGKGFTILSLPDGVFYIDPAAETPVSAGGECADAMLACVAPPDRNFAGCFDAVTCADAEPPSDAAPMCCPAACGDRYQSLLREGRDPAEAFAMAIFRAPSCIPGLDAHVGDNP